jgi:uncharacterized protein YqeY
MSTLIQTIKDRITQAMREKNTVEKDLLRTALGEVQTEESRKGSLSEADVEKVLRKVLKSLGETLAVTEERGAAATARQEIAILESILPQTLSVDQIREALAPVADAIREADRNGVATGIAMKHLKTEGAAVNGKDVAEAVKALRA